MKATTLLGMVIAAAAFASPAEAVFKCTTSKGIIYQDRPCVEGNESDVRIVTSSGELAPKDQAASDTGSRTNTIRKDDRAVQSNGRRAPADDSVALNKQAPRSNADTGSGGSRSRTASTGSTGPTGSPGSPASIGSPGSTNYPVNAARSNETQTSSNDGESSGAAERARNTEPTAKYYTTEGFSAEKTPAHMTCETANGEKRVFYLSNGKLTSI